MPTHMLLEIIKVKISRKQIRNIIREYGTYAQRTMMRGRYPSTRPGYGEGNLTLDDVKELLPRLSSGEQVDVWEKYSHLNNKSELAKELEILESSTKSGERRVGGGQDWDDGAEDLDEILLDEGVLTVQRVPYGGTYIEVDGERVSVGDMIRMLLDAGDNDIFYAPQGVSPESLEKLLKQDKENVQGPIEGWDSSVFSDYYDVDIDRVIRLYARMNNHTVEEIESEEW